MNSRIIGWRRNGAPVWSICGGSDDDDNPGTGEDDADDTGTADKPDPPDKPAADDVDWKAKSREWEKRAKANATAARKLQEIEDANKSDTEKLTDRATTAETKAATAELTAMRYEVALEKGLTLRQARRLVGNTLEELQADADEMLEDLGGAKPTPGGSVKTKPRPRLRGGADPDDEPEDEDPRALAAKVPRR